MKKKTIGKNPIRICCLILLLALAVSLLPAAFAASPEFAYDAETARPSVNGRLHVEGANLVDGSGQAVQLRGVSTHGLTWYPEYINENMFGQFAGDWNGSLIRLAMYSEIYCGPEKDESLRLMRQGIDACIASDLYVLVDWHILDDADPNQNIGAAMEFFDLISAEYADAPNLLFEICNEPNGQTDWSDVYTYSEQVIPVIRRHIPEAVIVVGTPEYDRNLGDAALRPLPFDNVMYVLHFYSATHHEGLLNELKAACDAGLPVFISECGICEASGDGRIDFKYAAEWFGYLREKKIGYAVWSFSDKFESSAFFKPGFDPSKKIKDSDLTTSGLWVRELIRGADPKEIPVPGDVVEKGGLKSAGSWILLSLGSRGIDAVKEWLRFAVWAIGLVFIAALLGLAYGRLTKGRNRTYDDIRKTTEPAKKDKKRLLTRVLLILSAVFTLIYLCWRVMFSIPREYGVLACVPNIVLLIVEILGFAESLILFRNLLGLKKRPLPEIPAEAFPHVDIFIATYNEPVDLLRRTVNGCVHMKYPDPAKVHIWICDDNRRPEMRRLAEEMGVGYFDRPDNKGAKAGNLNNALSKTSAPYVVTFDADMIPKSDFLLKTIPYFVDAELKNRGLPEEEQIHLGLLQTPQCFYDPDVFQHALYSEKRAPNEQDFFYRTIEPAKTSTNSVIYGGSNTVLSRRALLDIGGFYTESITEDFATGLLIESAGYVSLALPEPLASGQTPHTFREHIKQRTRWGRGVIVTARKLKIWRRRSLSLSQKVSYWSSVIYWYSPIKNLIYVLSPLLFAVFAIPVFKCSWLELLVFWLPMFVLQDVCLRVSSNKTISQKWSGIYETSVMPHLLIPIIKESMGVTMSAFKVTDKSRSGGKRQSDFRSMIPFIVLAALSVIGILRIIAVFDRMQAIGFLILLFWIVRNLYFLILAIFLVDGRDSDGETVSVIDAIPVTVETERGDPKTYEGVTTRLTEHNLTVFLDEGESLGIGEAVRVSVDSGEHRSQLRGVVTGITESRRSNARTQTVDILDFGDSEYEYWEILYDRIPTLPQSLTRDFGILAHLWQNIAHRVARTRK